MSSSIVVLLLMLAATTGAGFRQPNAGAAVAFPEGYREWVHVKSALISAQHPDFQRSGGFRHIYADPRARVGYRTGTFPPGSTIVVDWIEGDETDGSFSEGARRRLDVMVKDPSRFAATGGWGFERFAGASRERTVTDARAQCASCHSGAEAREMVFSRWRE